MSITPVMEEAHEFATGLRAYLQRVAAGKPAPATVPAASTDTAVSAEPVEEQPPAREAELAERMRAFEAEVARFRQHERAVAERERKAAEREQALAQRAAERRPVRDALREHAELSVGRIVQVFEDALAATSPSGTADHAVRLTAARVLLGEAYAADGDAATTSAAIDELAALRVRRAADSV